MPLRQTRSAVAENIGRHGPYILTFNGLGVRCGVRVGGRGNNGDSSEEMQLELKWILL